MPLAIHRSLCPAARQALQDGHSEGLYTHIMPNGSKHWKMKYRFRFSGIASVVKVHRLREGACLYGFARFEAAPAAIDGDIEEII